MKQVRSTLIIAFALAASALRPALAQEFPTKAVTIVVPTAPSSVADVLARALSTRLAPRLGQTVIVDNRTGAGGNIGIAYAAKAPADGHTLLLTANTLVIAPLLQKNVGYDPVKDFSPIGRVVISTLAFVVKTALPANSVNEFVTLAKARPRQLNYATPGNGTPQHLEMEHFKQLMGGLEIVHVPFSQSSAALTEILAGRIDCAFVSLTQVVPHAKEGRLRILAVAGEKRAASVPDRPSFAELGLEALDNPWVGLLAPAGSPPAAVSRIARELQALLAQADLQEALSQAGMTVSGSTPTQFSTQIQADLARWRKVIDAAGIKAD